MKTVPELIEDALSRLDELGSDADCTSNKVVVEQLRLNYISLLASCHREHQDRSVAESIAREQSLENAFQMLCDRMNFLNDMINDSEARDKKRVAIATTMECVRRMAGIKKEILAT